MSERWLLGVALCAAMGVAHAEDNAVLNKPGAVINPASAEVSQSLTVVGYSDSSRQIDDNTISPVDPAIGVRVDYQPFDSSFNMSAANFQTQPNSLLNKPQINRTYLGVGWKKLLDDAQNLGVRVDIGAVYDDKSLTPNKAVSIPDTQKSTAPATTWQPVISLGVSYRF